VMVHSSSANHIDLGIDVELITGKRSRLSFAPMVIETGTLMAFEVVKFLLGRDPGVNHRGVFLNPWTMTVERPRSARREANVPGDRRLANVLRVGHVPSERVAESYRLPVGEQMV
jgi:hypothetical protein